MEDKIRSIFLESLEIKEAVLKQLPSVVEDSLKIILPALKNGNKILICGNGGSAADAQHFAAELICTFQNRNRGSIPAIALTANSSIITAYSNDFGFKGVFERQVLGLGKEGDVLVGITTSGNSENVIRAFNAAKEKKLKTICLNGSSGGKINDIQVDVNIIVPSNKTPAIQESHIMIIHTLCKIIEEELFGFKER